MRSSKNVLPFHLSDESCYLIKFGSLGLRMYAIIPGPLPRIVPPNMVDLTIAGIPIPAGSCVATQAWSLHRQEDIFPE